MVQHGDYMSLRMSYTVTKASILMTCKPKAYSNISMVFRIYIMIAYI